MNRKLNLTLLIIVLIAFTSYGQSVKKTLNLSNFTGVDMGISGELYLKQGNTTKVVVETSNDRLEELEIEVHGNDLKIRNKRNMRWGRWSSKERVTIYVTIAKVESLRLSGSGRIKGQGPIKAGDLELRVSGSGKMQLNTDSQYLESSISGSGKIYVSGSSKENEVRISGSGELEAEDLKVEDYHVSISGSGNCRINVSKSIDARVSGSGDIYYSGNPQRVHSNVSGSGKIRKI